jgi:hypothetical protein
VLATNTSIRHYGFAIGTAPVRHCSIDRSSSRDRPEVSKAYRASDTALLPVHDRPQTRAWSELEGPTEGTSRCRLRIDGSVLLEASIGAIGDGRWALLSMSVQRSMIDATASETDRARARESTKCRSAKVLSMVHATYYEACRGISDRTQNPTSKTRVACYCSCWQHKPL